MVSYIFCVAFLELDKQLHYMEVQAVSKTIVYETKSSQELFCDLQESRVSDISETYPVLFPS